MGVTIFKDVLAWSMVAVYIGLALTARKGIYHDRRVQWQTKDEFHELTDYEPRWSFTAWAPREDGIFDDRNKIATVVANNEATQIVVSYETKV